MGLIWFDMVWWVRVRIPPQDVHGCAWNLRPSKSVGASILYPENHTNKTQGRKQEESSTNQSRIFCVPFDVVFPAQLRIGQSFIRMVQNCFNSHPKPHENKTIEKIWKQSILLHFGNEFRHANNVITSCKNREDAKRINAMKLTSDITLNNHMILQETSWNNMKQYETTWWSSSQQLSTIFWFPICFAWTAFLISSDSGGSAPMMPPTQLATPLGNHRAGWRRCHLRAKRSQHQESLL